MSVDSLKQLGRAVATLYQEDRPETFWMLEPYFRALLESSAVTAYVNDQLTYLQRHGMTSPELGLAGGTRFAVPGASPCQLTLDLVRTPLASHAAYSPIAHRFVGWLAGPPLPYRSYEQSVPDPIDQLDQNRLLTRGPTGVLGPGDVLRQWSSRDLLTWTGGEGESLVMALQSPVLTPLLWEYNTDSLIPTKIIAADPGSTRLAYIAMLLREMRGNSAVPQLIRLATHDNYTVRWAAIRAVASLDAETGLRLVNEANHDPHPQIRAAAGRAIAVHSTRR